MYKPEDTDTWSTRQQGRADGLHQARCTHLLRPGQRTVPNMVFGRGCQPAGQVVLFTRRIIIRSRSATSTASTSRWASALAGATARFTRPITTASLSSPDKMHSQVTAPGYSCCYAWGIRHLPGNPWDKTRIDDEEHLWLLEDDANDHIWLPERQLSCLASKGTPGTDCKTATG